MEPLNTHSPVGTVCLFILWVKVLKLLENRSYRCISSSLCSSHSLIMPMNLVSGFTTSLNLLSLISTLPSILPDPMKHFLYLSYFMSVWQLLSMVLIPSWNPLSSELLWSFSQGVPPFTLFLLFYHLPVLFFSPPRFNILYTLSGGS